MKPALVALSPEELSAPFYDAACRLPADRGAFSCVELWGCQVDMPRGTYPNVPDQCKRGIGPQLEKLITPLGIDCGSANQFGEREFFGTEARQQARFSWLMFLSQLAEEGFFHQNGPVEV